MQNTKQFLGRSNTRHIHMLYYFKNPKKISLNRYTTFLNNNYYSEGNEFSTYYKLTAKIMGVLTYKQQYSKYSINIKYISILKYSNTYFKEVLDSMNLLYFIHFSLQVSTAYTDTTTNNYYYAHNHAQSLNILPIPNSLQTVSIVKSAIYNFKRTLYLYIVFSQSYTCTTKRFYAV